MEYYFSEKGFEVCRIDGNVKLSERKRQVIATSFSLSYGTSEYFLLQPSRSCITLD